MKEKLSQVTKNFFKKYQEYYKVIYICFISLFIFVLFIEYKNYDNNDLVVAFLDVGQGDSELVKTPENYYLLIDTGPNYKSTQETENILPYFHKNLDTVLLTHPDLDHVGGTEQVIKSLHPENFIISRENMYEDYQKYASTSINYTKSGDVIKLFNKNQHGIELETLNPIPDMAGDSNHKAIVSRILYGKFEFIFMADADQEIERSLISKGYFLKDKHIKVLKVGHHGSDTASSEIFLKTLKPNYCVISVGKDNSYGHPKQKTLEILTKYCGVIYRTDRDGTIKFRTNGKDLLIERN